MWDLPGPGLEPMSPALAGGFLTTVPPGKSKNPLVLKTYFCEALLLHPQSRVSQCLLAEMSSGRSECSNIKEQVGDKLLLVLGKL